jgi:uncharacterized protein YbjT (DUF2867 family)
MKVLITGATGFLGPYLLPKLKNSGHTSKSIGQALLAKYLSICP